MENHGIYFTDLKLQNVRCFGEEAYIDLSDQKGGWNRWNIILGDNGTGKTTILQCLARMELKLGYTFNPKDKKIEKLVWSPSLKLTEASSFLPLKLKGDYNTNILLQAGTYDTFLGKKFEIFVDCNIVNYYHSSKISEISFETFFLIGYGANRRISHQIFSEKEIFSEINSTLFDDDGKLINSEEWLYSLDYAAQYEKKEGNEFDSTVSKRDLVLEILKDLLPDVEDVKIMINGEEKNPRPVLRFLTPYGWASIHQLSFGYKTMVAWMVDVAARMFEKYPDSPAPLAEPVVILVDEIDLHLHPKWQRDIYPFLEQRFPRAQFIVTAHSPLMVQNAPKDANIIVLHKEATENGYIVKVEQDKNFVRNWRVDQILASDLFENVGSRNKEVEEQMAERTKLLQKQTLSAAEQKRLDELNELSESLPTADEPSDIRAMEIIRSAVANLKSRQG